MPVILPPAADALLPQSRPACPPHVRAASAELPHRDRARQLRPSGRRARRLPALPGRARFVVSSPTVWRLHGDALQRRSTREEPILIPDGERFKNLATVGRIYDALIRAKADRGAAHRRDRRRRHRRHGRLRRGHVPARHAGRPGADDAAGAGGQRDRRQGRRQSSAGQESDRRVSSAGCGRWSIRRSRRRCRAASSAPGCTKSSSTG